MKQIIHNAVVDKRLGKCIRISAAEFDDQHADERQPARWAKNKKIMVSDQEKVDRLAIERGEDDGMIITYNMSSNAYNKRNPNDPTKRK